MVLFLILLPFAVFAGLMLVATPLIALFTAAAVASAVVAYDVRAGRSWKMLPVGSMAVFLAVGGYIALVDAHFSATAVRLAVDAGVLSIALVSMAIRLPFTLQYAREMVDAETLKAPGFRMANYIITGVWAGAFILMLVADMLTLYAPSLPLWVGVGIAFAARNCAVYFTRWYPDYRRARMARSKTAT